MKPTNRGFTLVELMVVMVILSAISLAVAGALRSMAQTGERIDARLQAADEQRVVLDFLRDTLSLAIPQQRVDAPETGSRRLFDGRPDSLVWIGIMPAGYTEGGRHFFRLALEPDPAAGNASQTLTLRFIPAGLDGVFPDWSAATARVLLRDVQSLSFAYHDDRVGKPPVTDRWDDPIRLPRRIQMSLAAGAAWPDLVVAVRHPYGVGVAGAPQVETAGYR